MKTVRRTLDRFLAKPLRHFLFVLVRTYYGLFYNVSCTNKHLLQDTPGALILATHVSRHDGPLISSTLYTTVPVRPAVHYKEYHHLAQRLPMLIANAIPMSSPKSWPAEKRAAQTQHSLNTMRKVIKNNGAVLLFPSGHVRTGDKEEIKPFLRGAHEVLSAVPDCPVIILRTDGLGPRQRKIYDGFWSFLGIQKGRRHVSIDLHLLQTPLDTTKPLEVFNKDLETLLNTPVGTSLPQGT